MKHLIVACVAAVATSGFALPQLTDVNVVESGSHAVTISYKLTGEPAVVTVDVQTNAAGTWASIGGENITPSLAGAVNRYVENGTSVNVISWRPNESWPGYRFDNGTAKVVLTAWPTNAPPTFMVVDMKADGRRITYYPDRRSVPGGVTNDMYKTDKIILRKIPAAGITWQMGSPTTEKHYAASQKLHDVKLTEDYYMACYETTKGYWDAVNAYSTKALKTGLYNCGRVPTDNYPASYSEAEKQMSPLGRVTYGCVRGTQSTDNHNWPRDGHSVTSYSFFGVLRHMTGGGILFDLPTEAQWEFAARAGTATQTYYGDPFYSDAWSPLSSVVNVDLVCEHAWAGGLNTKVDSAHACHPVGLKKPNAFDLYDVMGNEWECCLDQWKEDLGSDAVVDPKGADDNPSKRVFRGSCFQDSDWWNAKSSSRTSQSCSDAMWGTIGFGFRIWAPAIAVKE